ncbi:unnamed protein product [Prorocentrum cordatum]|uniref:PROP1-like PPR domain-containing protein n=1 Tax=Prorocentrum cordatum TaxID=2364126 RepID=A0ABN9QXZ1_9DINO|nr:unnamed protein product [Polarella glacialis]
MSLALQARAPSQRVRGPFVVDQRGGGGFAPAAAGVLLGARGAAEKLHNTFEGPNADLDVRFSPAKRALLDARGREAAEGRPTAEQVADTRRIRERKDAGDWQGALQVLRSLDAPTQFQYATALDACTKALAYEEAWELWREMPASAHGPSRVAAHNMMIRMCGRLKKRDEAQQLFDNILQQGLTPSVISYTELIQACAMVGEWEEAMRLLDRLRAAEQWQQAATVSKQIAFAGALTACGRRGRYEEGRQLFELMRQEHVPAQHNHFNTLLTACAYRRDAATAAVVFAEMKAAGLEPRIEDYTSFMVSNVQDVAACEALLAEARGRGLKPGRLCLEALAAAALQAGDHARAAAALQEALSTCAMPPTRKTQQLEEQVLAAAGGRAGPPRAGGAGPEAPLPAGWLSATCPSSGRAYFWQAASPHATVTWQRP